MNFPSQIFLNYIYHGYRAAILKINSLWLFYMTLATYFCNEKLHRTMRTAIASYLLKLSPTEKFTPLSTSLLSKKGPSKSVDLPWTRRGRHCYYFCYCHGFSFFNFQPLLESHRNRFVRNLLLKLHYHEAQ